LHRELLRAGEMTRTEMRDMFARHVKSGRIATALDLLRRVGLAERMDDLPTAGRSAERWKGLRQKRPLRPKFAP
jgi:hypothetical protein